MLFVVSPLLLLLLLFLLSPISATAIQIPMNNFFVSAAQGAQITAVINAANEILIRLKTKATFYRTEVDAYTHKQPVNYYQTYLEACKRHSNLNFTIFSDFAIKESDTTFLMSIESGMIKDPKPQDILFNQPFKWQSLILDEPDLESFVWKDGGDWVDQAVIILTEFNGTKIRKERVFLSEVWRVEDSEINMEILKKSIVEYNQTVTFGSIIEEMFSQKWTGSKVWPSPERRISWHDFLPEKSDAGEDLKNLDIKGVKQKLVMTALMDELNRWYEFAP